MGINIPLLPLVRIPDGVITIMRYLVVDTGFIHAPFIVRRREIQVMFFAELPFIPDLDVSPFHIIVGRRDTLAPGIGARIVAQVIGGTVIIPISKHPESIQGQMILVRYPVSQAHTGKDISVISFTGIVLVQECGVGLIEISPVGVSSAPACPAAVS